MPRKRFRGLFENHKKCNTSRVHDTSRKPVTAASINRGKCLEYNRAKYGSTMTRLIITLLLCLIDGAVSSDGEPQQEQHGGQSPVDASPQAQPPLLWLDAVRTQREFREKQRRANRAAIDEHRRQIDPWGVARQEAREEETRRRREALKEDIERNRETLRNRSDWAHSVDPRYQGPPPPPDPRIEADGSRRAPRHPPTGWDNPWYFRGH